jgi:hypothetical protein
LDLIEEIKRDANRYSTRDYYIASFLKAKALNWRPLKKTAGTSTLYLKARKKLKTYCPDFITELKK